MKRTWKKLLSLVLVAALFISLVPAQAIAVQETEVYLPEIELEDDILNSDVFYLATTRADVNEDGHFVYLLRVGRGGNAESESTALVKIADMTAKYGRDYVVRVHDERTEVENPDDNTSLMEMMEGSDFEQGNLGTEEELSEMLENDPEAQKAYREGLEAALEYLEEESGFNDKYGDDNPYSEAVEEMIGETAETAESTEAEENADPLEAEIEAVPDGDEGAIPAIENGETLAIGDEAVDPVQQAANLFTGENATPQRLTAEGSDMMQDLQSIANVMTNVVVGASVELTFAPGETEKYLEIVPKDNDIGDGNRMFYIILGAPSGTTTNSAASSCAFTIVDDEEQESAVVNFSDAVYSADGESVTVTVERTGAMNTVISTKVKTTGKGTAQAGRDYSEVDAELVFPFGVDHLTLTIPVRTEYFAGPRDFGLTLEPTAGCTVGENGAATVKLDGTYTDKSSLAAAEAKRQTPTGTNSGVAQNTGSDDDTDVDIANLKTTKLGTSLDVSKPQAHGHTNPAGHLGSFTGNDRWVADWNCWDMEWIFDSTYAEQQGTVGASWRLPANDDYYWLSGFRMDWQHGGGHSGDLAWVMVSVSGKDTTNSWNDKEYSAWYQHGEAAGKGYDDYCFESTRRFGKQIMDFYTTEGKFDAWNGCAPYRISVYNKGSCDNCDPVYVYGIAPILRPFQVSLRPADNLTFLTENGKRATISSATTTNASIVGADQMAVFYMGDSFTVSTTSGNNVDLYGYMKALNWVDADGNKIMTLAESNTTTNTSILYNLTKDNINAMGREHTDAFKGMLRKIPYDKDADGAMYYGYANYARMYIKPEFDYIDATVTLRNPYDFPVTMTISGTTYTLAAHETRQIKAPDGQEFHMGDTVKVNKIALDGAANSLYTATGVKLFYKFNAKDTKYKETHPVLDDDGTLYISGTKNSRLNYQDVIIEPMLQDKDNKVVVRIKTDQLSQFITEDVTDADGNVTTPAGLLGQTGSVVGDWTYFTYADVDKTVAGKLYAITVTPKSESTVAAWYDANALRTYVGNTLYFTAGSQTSRNVITLSAATARSTVTLQGTLKYANYNLRTQFSGNASNVPAIGAVLSAGSAGGVANTDGFVTAGPIPVTGEPNRYLRYIVSVNGTDIVKELLLPATEDATNAPTLLWDFNSDNAMNASMGKYRKNLVTYVGEKDSDGNDFYTFTATGGDPFVSVDTPVDSVDNIQWVKVRARNLSGAKALEFYSCTDGNNNVRGASCTQIALRQDTAWHEYLINIPAENVRTANAYKGANLSSTIWTGKINWIRLDVMENNLSSGGGVAAGDQIQIDYVAFFPDKTSAEEFRVSIEEPKLLWDFNAGNSMNRYMGFHMKGAVSYAGETDGEGNDYYTFTATGNNPYVSIDMKAANTDDIQWVKIRARNLSGAKFIQLGADSLVGTASRTQFPLASDNLWHEYVFNLHEANMATQNSDTSAWAGKHVSFFDLDPMRNTDYDGMNTGDQIQIDYIAFFPNEPSAEAFRFNITEPKLLWDFNADETMSDKMGKNWSRTVSYKGEKDESGNDYYTFTATGSDPFVSMDTPVSSTENIRWVKIRAKNLSSAKTMQLFASCGSMGKSIGSTCIDIPIEADHQWHEYVGRISSTSWSGDVKWLRLDPLAGCSNGDQIQIDYVAFFPDELSARDFRSAVSEPNMLWEFGADNAMNKNMGKRISFGTSYRGERDDDGNDYYTFSVSELGLNQIRAGWVSIDNATADSVDQIQWVRLRARNVSGVEKLSLRASVGDDAIGATSATSVNLKLEQDAQWHDYLFSIPQANSSWTGRINWMCLYPMQGNLKKDSQIQIDYVAFFPDQDSAEAYRHEYSGAGTLEAFACPALMWDFGPDNSQNSRMGKTSKHQVSYAGAQDGEDAFYTFTASGDDPYVSLNAGADSAESFRWAKIRARNLSGAEKMELFACTGSNTKVNGDTNVQFDLAKDKQWHEYIINIPETNKTVKNLTATAWTGNINWVRIDPMDGNVASGSQIQIDYVAFFPTEQEARNFRSGSHVISDTAGNTVIDISANFPDGVSPVNSAIFRGIEITGEMSDPAYTINSNTYIPVVPGKSARMTVRVEPRNYTYSMTGPNGTTVEDTRTENPLKVQLVVYDSNDVYRGAFESVDTCVFRDDAFEFESLVEFVEPEELTELYDEDGKPVLDDDGNRIYVKLDENGNPLLDEEGNIIHFDLTYGVLPEPGDKLYLRLTTNRLAQAKDLSNPDNQKIYDNYTYADIFTGMSFVQPVAGVVPPTMGIDNPVKITYGDLPLVGSTGMNLNFPFVNVGIMRIYHGYRIYFGLSPVQIFDTIKGTHISKMKGAGGEYWSSIFKIGSPIESFKEGINTAKEGIDTIRNLAKYAKNNHEEFSIASLGSPTWRFDIAVGMYFDFIIADIEQTGYSESAMIFSGMGGYVNISLGFQMTWYFIMPVVFIPFYFGLEINGSVIGYLGADFNKEIEISYDKAMNGNANINDGINELDGGIRGFVTAQVSFGAGLCGTLGARFSGQVNLIGNWDPSDPHGAWGGYVNLKVGGIIDLFLLSIPLMFTVGGWPGGSFEYYANNTDEDVVHPNTVNAASRKPAQTGTFLLREGDGNDSVWLGDQTVRGAFTPSKDKQKILVTGAYEHPDSQLITLADGETVVLAFIDSDNSKGPAQRTTLKMATCANGQWSEAITVSNDNTADFQPSIAETRDGKVLVAWVSTSDNSVTDLSTDDQVMDYLNSMEVYAAFVELDENKQIRTKDDDGVTVADTEITRITNDHYARANGTVSSYYDTNPTVVCDMESGDAMIYYIKSGRSSLGDGQITDYINPYTNDCVVCYMPFNAEEEVDTDGRTVPAGWLFNNFYYAEMHGNTANENTMIRNFGGQRFLAGASYTRPDGTTERYTIPDFTAISYNGLAIYAYTVDTDGSNDTDADKEIYLQVYDFRNHETKVKTLITDDDVSDTMPQFFRSRVNTTASGGTSTDDERTHTKLFWYRNGKDVVYIDVTSLMQNGVDADGNLKTKGDGSTNYTYIDESGVVHTEPDTRDYIYTDADGIRHSRYTDPQYVYIPTEDSHASAVSADFKAVEDDRGNLYILWTSGVTDEDGNKAREIFGTGLVAYEVTHKNENGETVISSENSGWSKPYRITRDGFSNDELSVAMSGENLMVVHNRYRETFVEATDDVEYNGQVDFIPIRITDLALVADTMEPCGSMEVENISLYRTKTTTYTDSEGNEAGAEHHIPVTLPVGGEEVTVGVEVANNGMNVAEGYKLSLYANETLIDEIEITDSLAPNCGMTHTFKYTLPANVDGLTFKAVTQEMRDASSKTYYSDVETLISEPLTAKASYKIEGTETYQTEDGFRARFTVTNTGSAASSADDTLSIQLRGPANLPDQFTEEQTNLYSEPISLGIGETEEFDVPVGILPEMMRDYGFVTALITVQKEVVEQRIGDTEFMGTRFLSNLEYTDFDLVAPMNMTLQNVNVAIDNSADINFAMDLGDKFRGGDTVTFAVDDLTIARIENGKVVGVNGGETTLYATHAVTGATVIATVTVTGERPITEPTEPAEPTDPTEPTDPEPGHSPSTGDRADLQLWFILMTVSALGCAYCFRSLKLGTRNRRKRV